MIVGCEKSDKKDATAVIQIQTEAQATPTLIPGLPTSTPIGDLSAIANQDLAHPTTPPTIPRPATATPEPGQRLLLGMKFLEVENYEAAKEQFAAGIQSEALTDQQQMEALFALSQAQIGSGDNVDAAESLATFLSQTVVGERLTDSATKEDATVDSFNLEAYYFLGQAFEQQGDCQGAIEAYDSYLAVNPDMNAYIQPAVAACYMHLGDRQGAIRAYELAASGDAEALTKVRNLLQLAQVYLEEGKYPDAITQFDVILDVAQTDNTRGQALYRAGQAEMLAGDPEAAYQRFLEAVNSYPSSYDSYLALVDLVEAGVPVDDFQRGVVDYHAKAYEAALAALTSYIEQNEMHQEDTHLFLAWSYEALGNIQAALDQLDVYIAATKFGSDLPPGTPAVGENASGEMAIDLDTNAKGLLEKGNLLVRAGLLNDAVTSYQIYIDQFPDGADAPFAAWRAAALSEDLGNMDEAIDRYLYLATNYPLHEDAAEALYRAGLISTKQQKNEESIRYWKQAAELYPKQRFGAASLFGLLQLLPEEERKVYSERALNPSVEDYYAIRARDLVGEAVPFSRSESINLTRLTGEQDEAEDWLRDRLGLGPTADIRQLSDDLAEDERLIRGRKLWNLGLKLEAKRELENLRNQYVDDPLGSYQLALFFRDLGLYRSSILAATSIMKAMDVNVFDAPRFIGGLAYPTYYSDLVIEEAEKYDLDPLLQFALIRQESLFESFATSSAAAQGLSQVIPDTGAYIAQRLAWPDYKNEDLYKPYVGIAFGAYYLAQQIEAFDAQIAVALSAYNGGPGNAARWYGDGTLTLDQYVETVDFSETRQYIQRIYTGHAVYQFLYGGYH